MRRFFFPFKEIIKNKIVIENSSECHHMKNVLRLKPGDRVLLFNGARQEVEGIIESFDQNRISVEVESVKEKDIQYPQLILCCALPKKTKFEMIVEKATELGVSEIIPLETKHTVVKIKPETVLSKIARFEKIALSAAKQSQRADMPTIHHPTQFKEAIDLLAGKSTIIIPSLEEKSNTLRTSFEKMASPQSISFFIGPEGDFSKDEYAYAREKGAIAVTLGQTVLRVETAAISVLSFAHLYYHL